MYHQWSKSSLTKKRIFVNAKPTTLRRRAGPKLGRSARSRPMRLLITVRLRSNPGLCSPLARMETKQKKSNQHRAMPPALKNRLHVLRPSLPSSPVAVIAVGPRRCPRRRSRSSLLVTVAVFVHAAASPAVAAPHGDDRTPVRRHSSDAAVHPRHRLQHQNGIAGSLTTKKVVVAKTSADSSKQTHHGSKKKKKRHRFQQKTRTGWNQKHETSVPA